MSSTTSSSTAHQACQPCRRLKRKCTKELPECSLCVRLGKRCAYPPIRPSPTATASLDSHDSLSDRVQRLEAVLATQSRSSLSSSLAESGSRSSVFSLAAPASTSSATLLFPSSYFLDTDLFTPIPDEALSSPPGMSMLSDCLPVIGPDIPAVISSYLSSVHVWLPILSTKRLLKEVESLDASHSSLILLLLCMRLHDLEFSGVCPSYCLAKAQASNLENSGTVSLRLLQSLILIATYELGHAIYPGAYLTIGRVARLGMLMGLHDRKGAPQLFKPADTWTLREEERRTWWAVIVLDRYCNLDSAGLALAAPEPSSSYLLPIDDNNWNQGAIGGSNPLLVSPTSGDSAAAVGRFAMTCQAAHLLSHVLKHRAIRKSEDFDPVFILNGALQLHRTLLALDSHLANIGSEPIDDAMTEEASADGFLEPIALVCSARFLLYNLYACNEPDTYPVLDRVQLETELQKVALDGILAMAQSTVPRLAEAVKRTVEAGSQRAVSPLVGQCMYHAATECAWFIREAENAEMKRALSALVAGLDSLRAPWSVGEHYLALLAEGETNALLGM